MKTVFISIPWFFPAYKAGGPIQSIVNMVKELNEDFQYRIFTSNCDLNNEPLVHIETGKWLPYNDYTQVWYATTHNRSETILEQVKLVKPDILYIIGIYDWHFNMVPLLFCKAGKKIVSVRGMLHPGALSVKSFKKKVFLQGWKLAGLHKKVLFHVTDETEKKYTQDIFGEAADILIAANFPRLFPAKPAQQKNSNHLKLVSLALISPMKNHLLVLQALKTCTAAIEYHIYGPVKDTTYWQLCCLQIEQLPENIKVQYHGDVQPQLVQQVLYGSHVFIMPSKSENFGHSFAEALSAGLPLVTSFDTPWNGLRENSAGININPVTGEIADAIGHFAVMDADTYHTWSAAAAAYIAGRVDITQLKNEYRLLFAG